MKRLLLVFSLFSSTAFGAGPLIWGPQTAKVISTDGTAGQVLKTDGARNLSFATVTSLITGTPNTVATFDGTGALVSTALVSAANLGAAGGTGAVQYNAAGALAGDAAKFFWDSTNFRLGLGTATPSTRLDVVDSVSGYAATIRNTNASPTLGKGLLVETTSDTSTMQTWQVNGVELGKFRSNGNPAGILDVKGPSAELHVGDSGATSITIDGATALQDEDGSASNRLDVGGGYPAVALMTSGHVERLLVGTAGQIIINDTGGNGGNVYHAYTRRTGTPAATSATCTASCNSGEKATGGGCTNSLGVSLQDSSLTSDTTQSCVYLLATGDCTASVYCMQY